MVDGQIERRPVDWHKRVECCKRMLVPEPNSRLLTGTLAVQSTMRATARSLRLLLSGARRGRTGVHDRDAQRLPASQKPFPSSLQGSAQHRAITMTTTLTRFDSAAPGLTWTETTLGVCAGLLAAPMPRAYFDRVHVTCKAETSADSAMKRSLHLVNDGTAWVRGQEGSKATFTRLGTSPMGRGDSSLALQPHAPRPFRWKNACPCFPPQNERPRALTAIGRVPHRALRVLQQLRVLRPQRGARVRRKAARRDCQVDVQERAIVQPSRKQWRNSRTGATRCGGSARRAGSSSRGRCERGGARGGVVVAGVR